MRTAILPRVTWMGFTWLNAYEDNLYWQRVSAAMEHQVNTRGPHA